MSEIAAAFRHGGVSPPELMGALLARIAATEPVLKAYTTVRGEDAMREAESAAKELHWGRDRGPLHGVPVSVKDLIDTRGVRTTYGSRIYRNHVPRADAAVVDRLKRAGAIIVGKTATQEFALGGSEPRTLNPFDLERVTGGSSSGSGAALAAGSAVIALGSDTGGSIRIPASFCGIVGLKPSYGLVSRRGVFPESWSLDHVGPMTRCVEDAALLLAAIAGYDPEDPASGPMTVPDYPGLARSDGRRLRVGVPRNHFFDDVERAVSGAVRTAVDRLAECGLEVVEIDFPSPARIMAAFTAIDLAEVASNHRRIHAEHADEYLPEARRYVESSFSVRATTYLDALRSRRALAAGVLDAMSGVDALAVPSVPMVAPRIGSATVTIGESAEDVSAAAIRFLAPFNLTGMPAISVCCGTSGEGLPIGLQIVGKLYDDATVLRVAAIYEASTSWSAELCQRPTWNA